jgi:hypothetical protein
MKRLSAMLIEVIVLVAIAGFAAGAQKPGTAQRVSAQGVIAAAQQSELNSVLHQRAVAAGGKLEEVRDADAAKFAADLPSLVSRSKEILLVHDVTNCGGLSAAGDKVLAHIDVEVLKSWKGPHKAGDLVTFWVPAGGLVFRDRTQAGRRVKSFSGFRDGGRYVLFLYSTISSENGQSSPSLWLVGDGVQGAFLVDEEKVYPVYEQGAVWKTYNQQAVPEFLAELDGLTAGQR